MLCGWISILSDCLLGSVSKLKLAIIGGNHSEMKLDKFYDQSFYDSQKYGSFRSAELCLGHLWTFFTPASIVDMGCGAGGWLKAAGDLGANQLVGFDGYWNSQANMMDQKIKFTAIDLNESLGASERFDLAISLEVAEHLKPESSEGFVKSLTLLSDVVLFSAAYIGQGGTNHINERLHSDWATFFDKFDYAVFDLFRPVFWGNPEVDTCYAQNAFLYVKRDHALYAKLTGNGVMELSNLAFLNCVHPVLYNAARKKARTFKEKISRPWPELLSSVKKEFRRALSRFGGKSS